MAHKFKLGQRVSIQGFESDGTIVALPYNDESNTYIVEFDVPQLYPIGNCPATLNRSVVAESKYLKPIKQNR